MTFLATNGVQSYARAVRDAMGDLPPEQANAVLDGLDEHLAEIVAEGTVDLEAVLGSPESYAAELRLSAGLPAATGRTSWAAPPAALRSDAPPHSGHLTWRTTWSSHLLVPVGSEGWRRQSAVSFRPVAPFCLGSFWDLSSGFCSST
jgi:hypothetical protein